MRREEEDLLSACSASMVRSLRRRSASIVSISVWEVVWIFVLLAEECWIIFMLRLWEFFIKPRPIVELTLNLCFSA